MTNESLPRVFLLASDLMLSSTVSGAARVAGAAFQSGDAAAAADVVTEYPQTLLLIDLGGLTSPIADLAASCPTAVRERAVAYGPHVHTEKLAAARDAGIGRVISRGQFSSSLSRILQQYVESPA